MEIKPITVQVTYTGFSDCKCHTFAIHLETTNGTTLHLHSGFTHEELYQILKPELFNKITNAIADIEEDIYDGEERRT